MPNRARRQSKWATIAEPPPGARFRGYLRYSDRDLYTAAADKTTFLMQKAQIEAYAKPRGWVCAGWDEEPAKSGAADEIAMRPAFSKHLADATAGQFEVSLCFMDDRWARDTGIQLETLKILRRAGVYWATADGKWNINTPLEDGHSIAFIVSAETNAAYARKVSQKSIIARQLRARAGYHNGRATWGYQRPTPPATPPDAPYNWRPPRAPVEPHPVNFARLRQLGEWCAAGMSDAEIADKASHIGWVLEHRHKGVVPWSKAFLKELLVSPFPREFAPGSGHGTIMTPDGERIEGRHVAAWSWELWHRMDETRALNTKGTRGRAPSRPGIARIFSGLAVCASCGRLMHHQMRHGATAGYYSSYLCQSAVRGYDCATRTSPQIKTGQWGTRGYRGIRSVALEEEFASLVLDWELPDDWRAQIAAEVNRTLDDGKRDEVTHWRNSLQEERKRVLFQHRNGVISDDEMLDETARIDGLLATLPAVDDWEHEKETRITAADTLARQREYWDHATPEQRAEALRLIVEPYGIVVDLEQQKIRRIKPRAAFLPTFKVLLAHHWREEEGGWFLRLE